MKSILIFFLKIHIIWAYSHKHWVKSMTHLYTVPLSNGQIAFQMTPPSHWETFNTHGHYNTRTYPPTLCNIFVTYYWSKIHFPSNCHTVNMFGRPTTLISLWKIVGLNTDQFFLHIQVSPSVFCTSPHYPRITVWPHRNCTGRNIGSINDTQRIALMMVARTVLHVIADYTILGRKPFDFEELRV